MKHPLLSKNALITGTLLLTFAGLLCRIIGFFYRIFLSRIIGAEGLGIYQLIFPLLALCISLTSSGIQTSVSKFTAEKFAAGRKGDAAYCLYAGFFLSLTLSFLTGFFLYKNATFLAVHYLDEVRCAPLLQIIAFSLPFSSIHACINGYYYGLKRAGLPAVSQLLEQLVRVLSVYIIYLVCMEKNISISPAVAVWGIVCGEIFSALFCLTVIGFQKYSRNFLRSLKDITLFSIPLTANRVALNFFQSLEALLLPARLRLFGYTQTEALSVFGILTGMAMPMILFPTVLTNSVSVMLLPTISEAKEKKNQRLIFSAIKKTIESCMILGLFSTLFFLTTGSFIGRVIFGNTLSGTFIVTLSWICPFLFLSTTLGSILHGLGQPLIPFLLNLGGSIIRIVSIFYFVPLYGIRSYLFGMLISQLFLSAGSALALYLLCDNFHSA